MIWSVGLPLSPASLAWRVEKNFAADFGVLIESGNWHGSQIGDF